MHQIHDMLPNYVLRIFSLPYQTQEFLNKQLQNKWIIHLPLCINFNYFKILELSSEETENSTWNLYDQTKHLFEYYGIHPT